MGQPAVRKGVDKTKGHGKCKPVVAVQASDNVFINGIPAVRQGDAFKPHCKHKGKAVGGGTVYINGKLAQRVGDKLTCGDTSAQGSSNVFMG